MAATLASGHTILRNAACEPEVADLARLLKAMGARIEGAGTSTVHIDGVSELHGATHRVIPDRIETGTFLVAGAITNGTLELENVDTSLLESTVEKLKETGVHIDATGDGLRVCGASDPAAVDVETKEYPGFATDMQAQYMAFMTQARGTSVITENIFENRFMHASELIRMGADIKIEGSPGNRAGGYPAQRRQRHCLRSEGERVAGAGRARRRRRHRHRPRLPSRPRLRENRRKAPQCRSTHRTPQVNPRCGETEGPAKMTRPTRRAAVILPVILFLSLPAAAQLELPDAAGSLRNLRRRRHRSRSVHYSVLATGLRGSDDGAAVHEPA